MVGDFKRFNMTKKPNKQMRLLTPVVWGLSLPKVLMHNSKVDKSGVPDDLKPPYLLLCNHNAFMDFMIMTYAIFPYRANYVVAVDGFIGIEKLLRAVGGIGVRKFTKSVSLVRNMVHAKNQGGIVVLFPEARYSLCGTNSVLPVSLGKMVKMMNVPVVSLVMHGHHINCPFWHKGNRGVKNVTSEMKLLFTAEETQTTPPEEINKVLAKAIKYDDFAWQKENKRYVKAKDRAEGLHKVLYQCPACGVEYRMNSKGTEIFCEKCGKRWEMTELGELTALTGETEYSHIPDWYEWERANVRREIEEDRYCFSGEVRIDSLPNSKGYINLGKGHLTHDKSGFFLSVKWKGTPFALNWSVVSLYSCHIEYNYKGKGDCVDLNKNDDTFYIYPAGSDFSVTKFALATEELYKQLIINNA
jgi:1-acyl-sn-glycerol-3-phosphate acyltransferase